MKTKYHKINLKEKIINEIFTIIKTEGHNAVTIRKVGNNLDVSSAAIYRHFDSLEAAMNNVIVKSSTDFSQKLMQNVLVETNNINQLEKLAHNFLRFSVEDFNQYNFLFFSSYTTNKNAIDVVENRELPGIKVVINLLDTIKDKDNLKFDTDNTFIKLWSFIFGYSILVNSLQYEINTTLIREMIVSIMNEEKN